MGDSNAKRPGYWWPIAWIISVMALAYLAGAVTMHYKLPGARALQKTFDGADAALENWRAGTAAVPAQHDLDEQMSHPTLIWDQKLAYNGYTLFTVRFSNTVYLIDMQGKIVHRWVVPFSQIAPAESGRPFIKTRVYVEKASVLPNGDLLVSLIEEGNTPYGYGLAKLDKDSQLLWVYGAHTHHDVYVDQQNDNIYTLSHEFVEKPLAGLEHLSYPLLDDFIVLLAPDGKELDKISLLEAFRGTPYELMLYYKNGNLGKAWDIFHTNSIRKLEPAIAEQFPMFKAGQILVSMRNMHTLAVVDPLTRKVVWASGGLWRAQHDAHFLPNGHILLFDNQGHQIQNTAYVRILEFNPQTSALAWNFAAGPEFPLKSPLRGRVQRLPNGNTLITASLAGRIVEVTAQKEIAWDYQLPAAIALESISEMDGDDNPRKDLKSAQKSLDLYSDILSADRYGADELNFLQSK